MPYVIKHKLKDRYIGNRAKTADYDEDFLVSVDYARFYSSERGAKQGLTSWCRYSVSGLINKTKYDQFEIVRWL